jgi:hypothetical protein
MSETKIEEVPKISKSKIPNIEDVRIPEILDIKQIVDERSNKRNAYLEQVAQHLVYNVPTRGDNGNFNEVTLVEYHSIDDDEWHEIEQAKAKLFDVARIQGMNMDDYKENNLTVPRNFLTLSSDYYKAQDDYNDMLLRKFLQKERSDVARCNQKMLRDICDAYELKHRLGLVNFQKVTSNSEITSSIM